MKINKDLVDATMMLSFISLVLVGTSEFQDLFTKEILMGALGVICLAAVVLRIIEMRQATQFPQEEYFN